MFFLAALPWALLLGFLVSSRSPVSWPDFAMTVLLADAAFGAALGATACTFTRWARRSPVRIAAFFLVMTVAGLLATTVIYLAASSIPHGKWARLPAPPEPALALTGPRCYTDGEVVLYLRTTEGHVYALTYGLGPEARDWRLVPAVPDTVAQSLPTCGMGPLVRSRGPWLPGSAVATYQIDIRGADCSSHVHFLLRDDRSIWAWSRSSCILGEMAFAAALALMTIAVSLVIALAVVLQKSPPRWPRHDSSSSV
jgi:hypothetical protein